MAEAKTYKPADLNKDGKVTKKEQARYDKNQRAEFMALLPAQYEMLSQDEQVKEFLDRKVQEFIDSEEGFSKEAFFIEMDNLPYFQKLSKAAIKDMDLEKRLPAVYEQEVAAEVEDLRDQAVQLGVQATDDDLRKLVVSRRRTGMSDAQVQNALANMVSVQRGRMMGQAGQLLQGIKQWAYQNGVNLSEDLVRGYVTQIQMGDLTENDVKSNIRRTYMSGAAPAWREAIDGGLDPIDVFSPHLNSARQILEDPFIDLNDPVMKQITQAVGPDGKPYQMPLYEAEKVFRQDPRWQKTDNAYATYASAADDILSMFGFR